MRLLFLVFLTGCMGPNLSVNPAVELGTGEVAFEALPNEGGDVQLAAGLQGGRHIWGAARVVGIDWREIDMTFTVQDADGVDLTEPTRVVTEMNLCEDAACDEGTGELVGITVLVEDDQIVNVAGRTVVLGVTAGDTGGRSATASKIVDVIFGQ